MVRIFQQYVSLKSILLVVLEAVVIGLGVIVATAFRFRNAPWDFTGALGLPTFALQVITVILAVQISLYYNDLYGHGIVGPWQIRLIDFSQAMGIACLILALVCMFVPIACPDLGVFVLALTLISLVLCSVRLALYATGPFGASQRNYLILGAGRTAAMVAGELASRKDLQMNVIGCVRPPTALEDEDCVGNVVGNSDQLRNLVVQRRVGTIVVALEDRRGLLPMADLVRLRVEGVEIQDAHVILAALRGRVCLNTVRPSWFVYSEGFRRSRLRLALKMMFDILFAAALLVLTAPIMLLAMLAVRLDSDGPILYRQKRVGLRGQPFYVLKLRSMRIDAELNGAQWASEDDPRVTRVGRWIRKFRLDELPQLFNVLRAEMSLVGPRPERPEFVDTLRESIAYYDERHSVRPGITGWAQVRYNYGSTIEDTRCKLEYDLFYLKNMSVLFDLAILLDTVRIVLTGRGGR